MTVVANTELRERFATCKGMTTQKIADALADVEQDEITRELLMMCIERSDPSDFNSLPLTIRQTLYGDDDISDWILRYDESGAATLEEADDDVELGAHVRWERWEDLLRLTNNDIQPMSLFYSLRCIALGEGQFRSDGRRWVVGVNFPNLPEDQRFGRIIAFLRGAVYDDGALREYLDRWGLDKTIEARAQTLSHTISDLGGGEQLAGSWLRWEVAGHDTMAQVDFAADGSYSVRMLTHEEAKAEDPTRGVVTWFATDRDFLRAAGGLDQLPAQLAQGSAKLIGEDDRLATFNAVTRRMYAPGSMNDG